MNSILPEFLDIKMTTKCDIAKQLMQDEDFDSVSDCENGHCSVCNIEQCFHETLTCHICLNMTCDNCMTSDHINVCDTCMNGNGPKEIIPGSLVDILVRINN